MIGRKIKRLRLQKGITQQALIEGLFDRTYLSQIERGLKVPPRETLAILASRLGVSVKLLTEYQEIVERVAHMLEEVRRTNDLDAARDAWELALSVQAIEQMVECAVEWARVASVKDAVAIEVLEALNHTIMLMTSTKEHFDAALDLFMARANTYFYLGMFDQAVWAYRDLEQRHPPNEMLGRVKVSLGSTLMRSMNFQKAADHFSQALAVPDITPLTKARAHQGVGACYRHLNRWSEAVMHLETAGELFATLEQRYRYMQTRHALGVLWLDKLNFEKAETFFNEVHDYYRQHDMRFNEAQLYEELARIAFYKRDYETCNALCSHGLDQLNGHTAPAAGRFFIWKSWCFTATHQSDRANDAWQAAKSLIGPQFKRTLETIDPNMTEGIRRSIQGDSV